MFCCVLALTLCGLLQRELTRLGVQRSIPARCSTRSERTRVVDVLYLAPEEGGEPELRTTLSQMTDERHAT